MSVMVTVLRTNLEQLHREKIELAARTKNGEARSEQIPGDRLEQLSLCFIVPYTVKSLIFEARTVSPQNQRKIIGKAEYFLYNVRETKEQERATRLLPLTETNGKETAANEMASLAGSIVIAVSHSSKRRVLREIEQLRTPTEHREGDRTAILQTQFEEISEIATERQTAHSPSQPEQKGNTEVMHTDAKTLEESSEYEVDREGYLTLKPYKPDHKLEAVLEQINENSIPPHSQIALTLTPKPALILSEPFPSETGKTPKKPLIFSPVPPADHINLNPSSATLEAFMMCCGEQPDLAHEVSSF